LSFYYISPLTSFLDRDEVTREENYDFSNELEEEEEEEWQQPENWENEGEEQGDVHDENSTYLDFLTEEVTLKIPRPCNFQY
jgi:hypothetical protein